MPISQYSIDSFTVCHTVCDFAQVRLLGHSLRAAGLPSNGRRPISIANRIHVLSADTPRLDPGPASLPSSPDARAFIVGLDTLRQSPDVARMVQLLSKQGWKPVVDGGRSVQSRTSIENWLRENSVPWIRVLPRRPEEFRTQLVIARSHLHILKADRLTPAFAIDSSSLAVASWRAIDIATFQLAAPSSRVGSDVLQ